MERTAGRLAFAQLSRLSAVPPPRRPVVANWIPFVGSGRIASGHPRRARFRMKSVSAPAPTRSMTGTGSSGIDAGTDGSRIGAGIEGSGISADLPTGGSADGPTGGAGSSYGPSDGEATLLSNPVSELWREPGGVRDGGVAAFRGTHGIGLGQCLQELAHDLQLASRHSVPDEARKIGASDRLNTERNAGARIRIFPSRPQEDPAPIDSESGRWRGRYGSHQRLFVPL